jgi:hypothetical protein
MTGVASNARSVRVIPLVQREMESWRARERVQRQSRLASLPPKGVTAAGSFVLRAVAVECRRASVSGGSGSLGEGLDAEPQLEFR